MQYRTHKGTSPLKSDHWQQSQRQTQALRKRLRAEAQPGTAKEEEVALPANGLTSCACLESGVAVAAGSDNEPATP
jgi:hypothetical protein